VFDFGLMPRSTAGQGHGRGITVSGSGNYVLGHSEQEQERLLLQARILRPFTDKFFRAAGIVPGMRVLDLGSGVGDVALLAGDIVGPGGRVVGLDRDANALERARRRASEQGCSSWVSFQTANLDDFASTEQFDAVVGRYILLYQPDAAATISRLMRFLKPGGIVAFHEIVFGQAETTFPPCELWDRVSTLLAEVFRRGGAPPDFGRRLGPTFLDAGLPFPTIVAEAIVGGGPGSIIFPWLAATVVNTAPRMRELGLAPEGIALDHSLAGKLEEAAVALGCQVQGPMQYAAWSRKSL
jgi:SAM-dependent methyltransferase